MLWKLSFKYQIIIPMTLLNSVTIIADVLSTMQKDRLMLAMIDGGLPNEALQEKAKFLVPPPFVTPPHLIFPLTNLSNHRITLVVKKTKKNPSRSWSPTIRSLSPILPQMVVMSFWFLRILYLRSKPFNLDPYSPGNLLIISNSLFGT